MVLMCQSRARMTEGLLGLNSELLYLFVALIVYATVLDLLLRRIYVV